MKITFPTIIWGYPEYWIYLPLVLIGIFFILFRLVRISRVKAMLARYPAGQALLHHTSSIRYVLKAILLAMAITTMFCALMRPMGNKREQVVEQEGRDLLIALDISRSMLAADCKPNRLACAKAKIKQLLSMLSSERVGLLLFSGSSIMQCPLTNDYDAFMLFLDQIDAEAVSSGSTALDQAIKKAQDAFSDGRSKQRKSKLLVIFTDGEDFSSNLAPIKRNAIQSGIHIFTFGVGTVEGAPIPIYDAQGVPAGHLKDRSDNIVISRLNEGLLQNIARESGSVYMHIREDQQDIEALANTVAKFERERFEDKKFIMYDDYYPYVLVCSLICLLGEWIV